MPKVVEELKVVEAVLNAMELVVELGVSLRRRCLDVVLKVAARSGAQQGLEVASRSGGGGEVWRRQQALEAVEAVEVVVEVVPNVKALWAKSAPAGCVTCGSIGRRVNGSQVMKMREQSWRAIALNGHAVSY